MVKLSDYFEFVSTEGSILHFRIKGLWTDDLMDELGPKFLQQFRQSVDQMKGHPFLTLADTSLFSPPSQKAKDVLAQAMKYAREHKMYKTVEVIPSAIGRIGIKLAAQETGKDDFRVVVGSVEEARAEIARLKMHLKI